MENKDFCHLHTHDQYSTLDGFGSAEAYTKRAKELGFTHLALTNHGNVDGVIEFQKECGKQEIKSIIGCEAYIVPEILTKEKGEKRYHITLLVKNATGWKNLLKMLTIANLQGFYHRARIDSEILLDHCEGLVVLTGCALSFIDMPGGSNLLQDLCQRTETVGELIPLIFEDQFRINDLVVQAATDFDINLVATMDCHYPLEEDSHLQEVLLAMQTKKKWSDPKRLRFGDGELYLKSADEMLHSFREHIAENTVPGSRQTQEDGRMLRRLDVPIDSNIDMGVIEEAMRNTMRVADLCDFRLEQKQPSLPQVYVSNYPDLSEEDQMVNLVTDGLERRASDHPRIREDIEIYEDRIADELSQIMPQFTRYFLVVWELINWCEENDIFVGPGRGSTAGSLVAYCLGITQVDPIKYKTVFSRFISPGRIDLPDIDMDFEDRRRDDVKKHLADTYGKWNVIEVSTFLKMHGRGAIRDVSRVFEVPLFDVDKAAKCIVVRSGGDFRSDFTIEDAFNTFEDGIQFKAKYPEVTEIAMAMEGQIKAAGRHAAGVCVSEHDLRTGENANFVVRRGVNVCNWEKEDAEFMGLMKLDILGLNSLTILSETKRSVKDRHGISINYNLIDLEDNKLYEQFTAGNTVGIFQFNSGSMIKLLREVHGENFDEVVAVNALHRPGALRSGMCQIYKARKFGEEDVTYDHPILEEITKDTYGMIIYQEQIMKMMFELGGMPWKTADTIRKVISKSKGVELFMSFKDEFVRGCERLGTLDAEAADKVFDQLKNYGSYGFNLSHAVSYSLIAVWQMYLKAYYPVEFMATLLSYGPASKKHELINETKRLGIKILLPDINLSQQDIWIIGDDNSLLAPFREIKGVGEVAAKEIVDCRGDADYTSPENLESRVVKRKVNSKVRNLLIEVKAYETQKDKLDLPEHELEALSQYFDFELSNDPLYRYRKLVKRIAPQIGLMSLEDAVGMGNSYGYFFGRMESLRVGYRQAVGQTVESSSFGSLGGVYGNMKDDTDFKMLIFGNKIYNAKKAIIEHCEGEAVLTYASNTDDKAALKTQEAYFGDELLAGELEGLNVNLGKVCRSTRPVNNRPLRRLDGESHASFHSVDPDLMLNINTCEACELLEHCQGQVLPSLGTMNSMIVGEAPGRQEDRFQRGFYEGAPAGALLWEVMTDNGLSREMFHVTNVCKCYPGSIRTPKKKHIASCSIHLNEEIRQTNPFIILSFGNTGNQFFRGESTGIMAINGTTQWNDEHNCWITYSVHPAMATYDSANRPLLEESIQEFARKIAILM